MTIVDHLAARPAPGSSPWRGERRTSSARRCAAPVPSTSAVAAVAAVTGATAIAAIAAVAAVTAVTAVAA